MTNQADKIKQLLEARRAATSGEWKYSDYSNQLRCQARYVADFNSAYDAEFTALAANSIEDIAAYVSQLEESNHALKNTLQLIEDTVFRKG